MGDIGWATAEQGVFYAYLQRRYTAGEPGSRLRMDQVVAATRELERVMRDEPHRVERVRALHGVLFLEELHRVDT